MANLSFLSQYTNAAQTLSSLVLVTPDKNFGYQPQSTPTKEGVFPQQPPSLLFHYEGEQILELKSDITDHFVEDNTAIQNQIALRPVTFTTHGFIGELNDIAPRVLEPVKEIATRLTTISGYEPSLSASALLAYQQAFFLYQTARTSKEAAISLWNAFNGNENQTKQQYYFQQFYGYWKNRILFTIQTPWAQFKDMAIESLRAIQDAETRQITDFEISFKKIQFAQTVLSQNRPVSRIDNFQGRSRAQASSILDLGISTPSRAPESFASLRSRTA